MKTQASITVRNQFIGYHRWSQAPTHRAFLASYHRHVFHVRTSVQVTDLNREVEFFDLQEEIQELLDARYTNKHFEESCEQIALAIINYLCNDYEVLECSVSEDGENEATVKVVKE